MATIVTHTLCNGGTNGANYDFTSFSGWQAGATKDLVANDLIEVLICRNAVYLEGDKATADYTSGNSESVSIDGWATDANHWIEIRTREDQIGNGSYVTGTKFRVAPGGAGNTFSIYENNVRFYGVETSLASSNAGMAGFHFLNCDAAPADWRIERCFVWRNAATWKAATTTTANNCYGVKVTNTGATSGRLVVINSGFQNLNHVATAGDGTPNGGIKVDDANVTVYAIQNTFVDVGIALTRVAGTFIAINNLIYTASDTPAQVPAFGTFAAGTDYNATNAASMGYTVTGAGNTHDRVSQTFTFAGTPLVGDNTTLPALEQYLAGTDAGARNQGDAYINRMIDFPGNYDVARKIRSDAQPDIGYHEYGGVAGEAFAGRIEATTQTAAVSSLTLIMGTAKMAFGESTPGAGYTPAPWNEWTNGDGSLPAISGDAQWGKLLLGPGEVAHSRVYDTGGATAKTLTLTMNQWGTGNSSFTLYVRGSASPFAQDAASPSWVQYTGSVQVTHRYIQVRVVGA